ncbi:hypothetical protein [Mammaliicoccus vitulinus]|uniref:LysM domain-containing protein n=1 Tax=Mammaliicoccus vitulinus TaxID=71237 RepID=A0ABX7HFB8_9STAP|nr:hypothetical protein [Mammaliicoccus vitulinus]PNZ34911.1 hypothetical protein CD107_11970 [Mammaliicoccus vitulinus]QRO84962.1 hypothetical protein I6J37_12410 [Mammaliicoccus vitulinus]
MKKLLIATITGTLLLGACGQKEETSSKEDTKETKKEVKKEDSKKKEKDTAKKSEPKTEEQTTEEVTTNEQQSTEEINTNEETIKNKSIDYNNVTDRNSLTEIIYGNYTEYQKILAYNSAVSNGVIAQGNVLEGPASAAYESSLRVESGKEKSIYDEVPETDEEESYDYEDNGIYRTPSEQEAHEDWVNGQVEWNNASESEKEEIRKKDAEEYGYEYDPDDYEE